MSEYVSRELFNERTDRYMELFKADKENLTALTLIVDQHQEALTRLVTLEESRAAEFEENKVQTAEMVKTLSEIAIIVKDLTGRTENHAGRLKYLEEKPTKKMDAILQSVVSGVLMLILGAIFGYLMNK